MSSITAFAPLAGLAGPFAATAATTIGSHAEIIWPSLVVASAAAAAIVVRLRRRGLRSPHGDAVEAADLRLVLATVLAAATMFLLMTGATDPSHPLALFDVALADTLAADTLSHNAATLAVAAVAAVVTHLGDEATLIAVSVALVVVAAARRDIRLAAASVFACGGNGLLNPALKHLFERVRPVPDHAYVTTSVYSFPSGHTSGSMVVYGFVAYVVARRTPPSWHEPIAAAAAALVVSIACSRVLLRVHWASDVAAGLASGGVWLAVSIWVADRLTRRVATAPSRS